MAKTPSDLIPGLLDEFVRHDILPRLPWYTRPVCRALSTSWRSLVDSALHDECLNTRTRRFQLPLLQDALLVSLGDKHKLEVLDILVQDASQGQKRKLPPIERLPPGPAKLAAWDGMVFVWTLKIGKCWSPSRDLIFKLDLGRGNWLWDCIPANRTSNWFDAIDFGGKIYSHWEYRHSPFGRSAVKLDVVVFDMETNACNTLGKWEVSNVGVVSGDDNLYGFSWHEDGTRGLMRYDAVSDDWKLLEVIPRGLDRTFALVGGDCFEPDMNVGMNIITVGYSDGAPIHWYNTVVQKSWVEIENRPGMLVCVARGVLYATCKSLEGCHILKGKIHVESSVVAWEVIADLSKQVISFIKL